MTRTTADDVVHDINWEQTAKNGDDFACTMGMISLEPPADDGTFIPYADISLDKAIEWVVASDQYDEDETKQALDEIIELQKNPIELNGVPWEH